MIIQLNNRRTLIINFDSLEIIKSNEFDHPILPSEIYDNGYIAWRKKGRYHRKCKPAIIYENGENEYWKNGEFIKKES